MEWTRLPPLDGSFRVGAWLAEMRRGRREERLIEFLLHATAANVVSLHASGREALRTMLAFVPRRSGAESEILLPAYTCFSVAAATVAAGLRVRLVDVDRDGQIARQSFAEQRLDNVVGVLVSNLFGLPEPIADLREKLEPLRIPVIDDAAQSFGAKDSEGAVGARGDLGLLSFARGKPLAGLGGGAVAWKTVPPVRQPATVPVASGTFGALCRGITLEVARHPAVFRWLSEVPALKIGETPFDPGFRRGGLDAGSLFAVAANLGRVAEAASARRGRARDLGRGLASETAFRPLLDGDGRSGVFPRLAVVAPDEASRDGALAGLRALGASRFYPHSLARIPGLQRYLVGETDTPGADALARRLFTLPTHERVGPAIREQMIARLRKIEAA